jgi:hypothetical protein
MRERVLVILIGATALLAACGGGTTPTSAPGQTTGSETTSGETTTTATTDTTSAETTSGGPQGSADACSLLTPGEITQATEHTNIVAQPVPDADTDAVSACGFVSEGAFPAVVLTILDPENTNTDPAGYLALPGSEEVQISGARAVWVPAAGNVMFIIKDGRVATILATAKTGEFKDAAMKLMQLVADRL